MLQSNQFGDQTFAAGHFAAPHFAARTYRHVDISPPDISLLSHFAARTFCRWDISSPGKFCLRILNHTRWIVVLTNFSMSEFETLQSTSTYLYLSKTSLVKFWYLANTMHMKIFQITTVIIVEGYSRNMLR